jgi:hypothetical protein
MPSEAIEPLPNDDLQPANDACLPAAAMAENGVFAPATPSDVQALVDAPCWALDVEYKSWRNLNHAEDRAELARDIAALANHGGGHVIFGFDQDTLIPEDTHPFLTNCTTEQVGALVHTYLQPPVACEVVTLRSAIGNVHPVIRVASHGTVPVCIRQDGPIVGMTPLIERGVHYTRKHGGAIRGNYIGIPRAETGRIETPQEWAPLIRRCVRRDRETLLALIEASIEGRLDAPLLTDRLAAWHAAAHAAFLGLVPLSPVAEHLERRHYALSYGFELSGPEMLDHAQLPELLRRVVFELQPMFRGVMIMFDPPYRRAVRPRFAVDAAADEGETDFLEVAWLRDRPPNETADFWRLSPRGLATIARDYAEDRTAANQQLGIQSGTWFSPNILAQEIADLVCHARALARFFAGARRVHFRCEWWGLAGRELFDPHTSWAHRGSASDDHRIVTTQATAAGLAQAWPDVVARIMAPVLRAFEPDLALGPDWVRAQMPRWALGGSGR